MTFAQLKNSFRDALPFLGFFVVLFFAEYALFGRSDAMLGIVFLFFAKTMVHEPGLSFRNFARRSGWFMFMAICATLAGLNPVAMVLGSALYMLFIVLVHSDDYLPRNFFWLGLGYLLLLIYPVGPDEIGLRIVATLCSIVFTAAFVMLMRWVYRRSGKVDERARDRDTLRHSFQDVGSQLAILADLAEHPDSPLAAQLDPKKTFTIAQEYAQTEYGTTFRQGCLLSGRQCYTFALLLCCEQLADLIHATARRPERLTAADAAYFTDLSHVLLAYGEGQVRCVADMAGSLRRFLDTHALADTCHRESWNGILEAMVRTLQDTRMARDNSTPFWKSVQYRLRYLHEDSGFSSTQTRFALRLAVIIGVTMLLDIVLGGAADTPFGIWVPIVAFTVLNTYNDETLKATLENAAGTIIGIVVFTLFVHFIPEPVRMPLVVTLGYLVILMNISPIASTAAGTQMALTAFYSLMDVGLVTTLISRLVLVLIAVSCVMMVIFVFMRTRRRETIRTKIRELERIDTRITQYVHEGIKQGRVSLWRSVRLLYRMHLNAMLLEELAQTVAEKGKRKADKRLEDNVNRVLERNYRFAMDAEHAVMLLDPRRDTPTDELPPADRGEDFEIIDAANEDWENPDSRSRKRHINATADRLDDKADALEEMRFMGRPR